MDAVRVNTDMTSRVIPGPARFKPAIASRLRDSRSKSQLTTIPTRSGYKQQLNVVHRKPGAPSCVFVRRRQLVPSGTMDAQSLHSKTSQETFISLLQLEPKPIDSDTPMPEKPLPALPEEASMESSSSKGEEELMSSSSTSTRSGNGPSLISFRKSPFCSSQVPSLAARDAARSTD